jgi:3-oxoacyl-[acyl-carrier protein] reductase
VGVQRFVEQVAKRFGRIDVCVANAGGPPAKNFLSIAPDEWRKAFELNFMSAVHLAKAAIPYMQRHRWGRIITITSVSVKQPVAELIMSNAVRAAVVGLVKSLSNEFGKDGILVNNVAPGYTATERLQELAGVRALAGGTTPEQIYASWAAEIPLKRLGDPRDIADVIVWLASERAAYVTGQTILADGGIYRGL